jgi:uncharacterized membrane protein YdbT with pleckstrin-like domain
MTAKIDKLGAMIPDEEILWRDRKRYLGLPISFTVYSFDRNRFYLKKGFFNTTEDEMLLYRILDVKLSRTLFQKIFGVGSIMLVTADKSDNNIEIRNIKKPDRTRKALSAIVEKERDEKRILGKEMFGTANIGLDNIDYIADDVGDSN